MTGSRLKLNTSLFFPEERERVPQGKKSHPLTRLRGSKNSGDRSRAQTPDSLETRLMFAAGVVSGCPVTEVFDML